MLTQKQLEILKSDNELLQLQLEDVNQIIHIREEELSRFKNTVKEAAAMQSKLDQNLNEFEQMQLQLGSCQQKNSRQSERLEALENELYQSINEQLSAAEAIKKFERIEAHLKDTINELQNATAVYQQLFTVKKTLAAANSDLEIALIEIDSLKEELQEVKALNDLLIQKKIKQSS